MNDKIISFYEQALKDLDRLIEIGFGYESDCFHKAQELEIEAKLNNLKGIS